MRMKSVRAAENSSADVYVFLYIYVCLRAGICKGAAKYQVARLHLSLLERRALQFVYG